MVKQTRREFLKSTGVIAVSTALGSVLPSWVRAGDDGAVGRPNILFLFPDQHRFDWVGMNPPAVSLPALSLSKGSNPVIPVRTPNLDKLMARGIRFTNAFTPSPLCAPARACLASGREYGRCGVLDNGENYPLDQTTFYTLLRDSGYHVMGCGKFDLHKGTFDWGLDGKHLLKEWGFSDGIDNAGKLASVNSGRDKPREPYMAFLEKRGLRSIHVQDFKERGEVGHGAAFPTPIPDDAYCDNWLAQNGIDLIRRAPKGKPWFLQVNFTGPHPPWDITESMTALYKDTEFPQPNGNDQLTPEQHVAVRRNYSAMITNIDRWIGIYLDELAKRGELENTLIVYSSDHGEMLGDHNLWGKSDPYQPSVGVPLVIAGPGVRKGVVSKSPASTVDLAATFLETAGVARLASMDSRSLCPLLEGATDRHRHFVYSGLHAWRMVYDGRYKLVTGFKDANESVLLFDLENDPLENNNISAESPRIVERLSRLLKE
jgi:arylsulfatase A-like enzyme